MESNVFRLLKNWLFPQPPEAKYSWKYPWKKNSRSELTRLAFKGSENEVLRRLRDQDLINPAPFTHQTLIEWCGMGAPDFEKPFNHDYESSFKDWTEVKTDVPVTKIIGILCTGNLKSYSKGMTFREVLFESLHGEGITEESVEFLIGPEDKDHQMPHRFNPNFPKSASRGPLKFSQFGDWFIAGNGQQRAIIAMYAIWQQHGDSGLIKNVSVSRWS